MDGPAPNNEPGAGGIVRKLDITFAKMMLLLLSRSTLEETLSLEMFCMSDIAI